MREKTFVPTFEPLERRDLMTGNLPALTATSDVSQYTEQVQAAVAGLLPGDKQAAWQEGDEQLHSFMQTLPLSVSSTLTSLHQEETKLLAQENAAAVLSATLPTATWTPALRDAWNAILTPAVQTTAQALTALQTAIQTNAGNPSLAQGLTALHTLLSSSTAADGTKITWQALQAEWNTAQTAVENITQIASFNTIARRSVTGSLQVQYANLPANLAVRFGTVTVPLAAGSGTTTIPLQSFTHGDRRVYIVQIVQAGTGVVVIDGLGGFGVQSGKHTYAAYSYDPQANIPALPVPTVGRSEANTMKMDILQRALPLLQTTHVSQTGQTLSLPAVPATAALESVRAALEANRHSQALMEALPSVAEQECEEFAETKARAETEIAWEVLAETEGQYREAAQRLARAQKELNRANELLPAAEQAVLERKAQMEREYVPSDTQGRSWFTANRLWPAEAIRDGLLAKKQTAETQILQQETTLTAHRSSITAQSSSLTALGEPLSPTLELLPRAWITSLQRSNVQVHLTGKGPMTAYIDGPFYGSVLGSLTVQDLPLSGTGGIVSIRPESPAGTYTLHVKDGSNQEVWSVELSWNGQQFTAAEADKFSETSFRDHVRMSRLPVSGNGTVETLLAQDLVEDEEASLLATIGTSVAAQGRLLTNAQPGYSDVRNAFQWSMFDASGMAVTPEQIQTWWYTREPFMNPQNFAQWKAAEAIRLNITPAAFPQTYLQELGALDQRLHADWQVRWDRVNQDAGYYNTFLRTIAIPETLTAIASIQAGGNEGTVMAAWRTRMNLPYSAFQSYLTETGWVRPSADSIWQNVLGMVRSGKAVDISANFNTQDAAYAEWNDNRMNKNAAIDELITQLDTGEIDMDDLAPGDRARIVLNEKIKHAKENQAVLATNTAMKIAQAQNAPESSPERQQAYARAAKKAEVVLNTSTHPKIVAIREQNPQLFASMLTNLKGELLDIEIVSMQTIATAGVSDGFEAAGVVIKEKTEDAVLGEIYSREMLAAGVEVNTGTAAGRYFAEVVHDFWNAATPQARTSIAESVEAKTGISRWKVLERVEYNGNAFTPQGTAQNLRDLFVSAQYGSAFAESMNSAVMPVSDKYVGKDGLADVLTTYRTFAREGQEQDQFVRVRFNVNVPNFHHAMYYLLDENGEKVGAELPMKNGGVESGAGVLFAEFDAKDIGRRLESHASEGGPEYRTALFSIRVVVWTSDKHEDRVFEETPQAKMEIGNESINVQDLSTLPAGPEHERENVILSQIKQHLPFTNDRQWMWTIASGYHDGMLMHAVDLDWGKEEEVMSQKITAPADGTVKELYIDSTDSSILVLEHALSDGTTWSTVYMHFPMRPKADTPGSWELLDNHQNILRTLKKNDDVMQGSDLMYVGTQGPGNAHLHFEVHVGGWRSSASVDLRNLLLSEGVTPYATAGNRTMPVQWNTTIGAWENAVEGVVLDRTEQEIDPGPNQLSSLYWIAYHDDPNQRKRLTWIHQLPDGTVVDAWLQVEDFSKKWNYQTRSWENR